MTPDEEALAYEAFIKAQVDDYKKRHPNAHKEKVPDNVKRHAMDLVEKIDKYTQSDKFKSLKAKYQEKLKKLYDEHGHGAYKDIKK